MKKKILALTLAGVSALSLMAFAGCGEDDAQTVSVTGSSSVAPVMEKLAAAYEEANENVTIKVTTSDSGTGITDTQEGKNDFGMASRDLKSSETGVTTKQIAIDGVALIVNTEADLDNVTSAEVYELYANGTPIGSITGALSRENGSGTRDAFDSLIVSASGEKLSSLTSFASCVSTQNSTGNVMLEIAKNKTELGYISLGSVDDSIKVLTFEGVEATAANVKNGSYALSRPFNIVLSESRELSDAAQAFVDYIMSADGQAIITANGYVSVL